MLLREEVYGAMAFVYTGSQSPPDIFIPMIVNDDLQPGKGKGGLYGKGLYTVYDLPGTQTEKGFYGNHIYKLAINLYGYLCFDMPVATKVYGHPMPVAEQAEMLELDEEVVEKIRIIMSDPAIVGKRTAVGAQQVSLLVRGIVKGLVFTGDHDGQVAVVYDAATVTPVAHRTTRAKTWKKVSKDIRKQTVGRAQAPWRKERYEENTLEKLRRIKATVEKFKQLGETPDPEDLIINGALDLSGGTQPGSFIPKGTGITRLPDGLHVKGNLTLDPNTTTLPRGLRVDGHLSAFWSKITEVPDDIQVGRGMSFPSTLLRLPNSMTLEGFSMDENPNITVWPPGLTVRVGDVSLYKSKIKRLPDGFTAPNDLILTDSDLEELPQGLKVGGNLDIRGTNLQLRDDIEVDGHIRMKVKFWGDIPDKFRNGRKVLSF
jgi:hypothetical protein